MAESAITFDSEKARKFFENIVKNVDGIEKGNRAFVNSISAIVFQDIMDHFNKEMGSDGKWKGWSKVYAERMARVGKGGNKILQDTGRLRQAFTPTKWRLKSKGIEWYNNAKTARGFPYAAAHNIGGSQLAKRDFMWLSTKALNRISQLTANWMLSGTTKEVS